MHVWKRDMWAQLEVVAAGEGKAKHLPGTIHLNEIDYHSSQRNRLRKKSCQGLKLFRESGLCERLDPIRKKGKSTMKYGKLNYIEKNPVKLRACRNLNYIAENDRPTQ